MAYGAILLVSYNHVWTLLAIDNVILYLLPNFSPPCSRSSSELSPYQSRKENQHWFWIASYLYSLLVIFEAIASTELLIRRHPSVRLYSFWQMVITNGQMVIHSNYNHYHDLIITWFDCARQTRPPDHRYAHAWWEVWNFSTILFFVFSQMGVPGGTI